AARAIPDDNLAYPVLITVLPMGDTASGFYLNTGKSIFFVTSGHVLFGDDGKMKGASATLLSYPKDINDKGHIVLTLDLKKLSDGHHIRRHKSQDVAVVFIGTNSPLGDAKGQTTFTDGASL